MANTSKENLEKLCKESYSLAEVLRKLGLSDKSGGNYSNLRKYIKTYKIDISHFTGQLWNKGKTHNEDNRIRVKEKYTQDEVFCKNSPVTQKMLRGYVKRNNLIEYKCCKCGCDGKWQGGHISLELDHIDGNNKNNTLSNLRYLCPNCHALTDTYRGKNIRKKSVKKS